MGRIGEPEDLKVSPFRCFCGRDDRMADLGLRRVRSSTSLLTRVHSPPATTCEFSAREIFADPDSPRSSLASRVDGGYTLVSGSLTNQLS